MSRTVVVEVTAEDIAAGVAQKCELCPVAIALCRAAGSARAYVDGSDICVSPVFDGDESYIWDEAGECPQSVTEFVNAFDGKIDGHEIEMGEEAEMVAGSAANVEGSTRRVFRDPLIVPAVIVAGIVQT